ncbi:MAG: hypothetical protein OEV45_13105, partial [Desulfobacteraceae bacterium]|nr:hypothetical protein [Desulfobacteraceae bacterium]
NPAPRVNAPPAIAFPVDNDSPSPCADDYLKDSECPSGAYFQSKSDFAFNRSPKASSDPFNIHHLIL